MNQLENIRNKKKIMETAILMVEKKINLIEGCRKISAIIDVNDKKNNFLLPLVGVASETDNVPLVSIRKNFSKEYLRELDEHTEAYININKQTILKICKEIIEKYSKEISEFEDSIKKILSENDPIKLFFKELEGKYTYETEIELILKEIENCHSEEQTADMIRYLFMDMYGNISKEDKKIFDNTGRQAWLLIGKTVL